MNKDLFSQHSKPAVGAYAAAVASGAEPVDAAKLLEDNQRLTSRCEELQGDLERLRNQLELQGKRNRELAEQVRQMRDARLKPMVRASNPDTSFSAEEVNAVYRKKQVQDFVRVFRKAGELGLTDEQAHDVLELKSHTPRVADMKRAGLLLATGEKRLTKSGSKARVYRLSPLAWQFVNGEKEGD